MNPKEPWHHHTFPYSTMQITETPIYQGKETKTKSVTWMGEEARLHNAWALIKHIRHFSQYDMESPNPFTILLAEHYSSSHYLTIGYETDGREKNAEKNLYRITGTSEQIAFLLDPKSSTMQDWLPSLLLHGVACGPIEKVDCERLVEYGINQELIDRLAKRRTQGSWIDIIMVNEVWITDKSESLGRLLNQYLF